jgi:DNA-binding response OmpR family regulator
VKVLLIEDDQETSAYIARGLREQGHVVDLAASGRDGLFLAADMTCWWWIACCPVSMASAWCRRFAG